MWGSNNVNQYENRMFVSKSNKLRQVHKPKTIGYYKYGTTWKFDTEKGSLKWQLRSKTIIYQCYSLP